MNFIRLTLIVISSVALATMSILATPFNYFKGIGTYYVYRTFARTVLFLCGVKLNIQFKIPVDKNKTFIIVSNHLSYLDIPVLMVALKNNIRFIYKKQLTKVPVFGWSMYLGGYVPIDRSNARSAIDSLKKAGQRMKSGFSIAIFPEGTRSKSGVTGEFKKGIFMLADFAEVDILPVSISGTNKVLMKDSLKIYPGKVNVVVNEPMPFKKDKSFLDEVRTKIVENII